MVEEKINQAFEILKEENIDCWLTFARETGVIPDPVMELIVGTGVTWQSAFILTANGDSIAIVGSLDKANQESHGFYKNIIGYVASIEKDLVTTFEKINPNKIAINYSPDSSKADGLTYGMYLQLIQYLKNTPFADRLIPSETIINKLSGRKSKSEIECVKKAINLTIGMFEEVGKFIKPGKTEKQVASYLIKLVEEAGVELAWYPDHCPAVFTGPDSAGAHTGPTDREVKPGHVLNIDFGVKIDGYCSDLQRSWYILKPGETEAPLDVKNGFKILLDSISAAINAIKPGATGYEIDTIARSYIVENCFEEYPHA